MSDSARERLPQQDYLCAKILRAEVDVQLGLHGWEQHREKPTRLWVDAELFRYDPPATVAGLADVIDYDRVRDYIRAWAGRPHTPLLETLAQELVEFCLQDPRVDAVRVALIKPTIFNEARGAGVELFRRRRTP